MKVEKQLRLLKCLSDEMRLEILLFLKDGERCVCEIVKELGAEQSLVSHHLQGLRRCGLVKFRQDGRKKMYRLTEPSVLKLLIDLERLSKKSC
jgi:ArsR family transcriptional regulator